MDVGTVGAVRARRDRKSSVCARARAEARVPIRRVRGDGEDDDEGLVGGCAGRDEGGGGGAEDDEL